MKRIHVDDIFNKKTFNLPGPATYTSRAGFGNDAVYVARYSMRPRNDPFDITLKKETGLPGPGSYLASVDLAGTQPASSVLHAQPSNAFSKAQDRFRVSGTRTPAPTNYVPKHNFNENVPSVFKKPCVTRFT